MDRCRCEEYAEAVRNTKIFLPGIYRHEIMEKFDRSGFGYAWVKQAVDEKKAFMRVRAWKLAEETSAPESKETRLIKYMWCPYMSQIQKEKPNT